ncbi:alpha/beta hydrolase-fold protein [Streptantibioticus parmotrematis]|uniref:alpha/beta hydrolase n=1 Tax=Streptantibioticus parmotrematis TaxID=2873249 RepID=UPI0033F83EBB
MERSVKKRWLTVFVALLSLGLIAGCSDQGDPVSFGAPSSSASGAPGGSADTPPAGGASLAQMATGPQATWKVQRTVEAADNTKIAVTTYHGPKSGFTGKVWVWAPPAYFQKENANKGFPVMIALPGGLGYPNNYWFGADLKLQEDFYKWTQEGKALPFIVVMPVLNPDKQYHDCSDIPGSEKMGTWLTEDVPNLVRENFRTLKTRDGWGYMGSSSGGFCSLKSVLQYPNRFKAAIPSGPDIVPDSPLWHGDVAAMRANNPEYLASQLIKKGGPDVYLGFQVGTTEVSDMAQVKKFIKQYGKGPVHTRLQVIGAGEHNAASYTRGMDEGTIQWISEQMQGPST